RCHVAPVRGWPCTRSTGGPVPPWRTYSCASPTSTGPAVKPSKSGMRPSSARSDGHAGYGGIMALVAVLDVLVPKLVSLPGVVAVVLGGSRARGTERPDSDWDVGLYYRGGFDADLIAGLGFPGHVAQPGEWGRIVNGGAWLTVEGQPVDVLLRDLDVVERWWADAQDGRFEMDNVEGHIAGPPTYP